MIIPINARYRAVEGLGELMVRQSKADTLVSALVAAEEVATQLSQALGRPCLSGPV